MTIAKPNGCDWPSCVGECCVPQSVLPENEFFPKGTCCVGTNWVTCPSYTTELSCGWFCECEWSQNGCLYRSSLQANGFFRQRIETTVSKTLATTQAPTPLTASPQPKTTQDLSITSANGNPMFTNQQKTSNNSPFSSSPDSSSISTGTVVLIVVLLLFCFVIIGVFAFIKLSKIIAQRQIQHFNGKAGDIEARRRRSFENQPNSAKLAKKHRRPRDAAASSGSGQKQPHAILDSAHSKSEVELSDTQLGMELGALPVGDKLKQLARERQKQVYSAPPVEDDEGYQQLQLKSDVSSDYIDLKLKSESYAMLELAD
eukprot:CAMPEP_0168596830 /NCGR_PEP_ID=MMETSP0420-20121227/10243_1 /TAXON_ID=498008 /ORGANISM="Pessonella sp." /LENGTH=314 /DNA_ID=CAMNT_0008633447 /DNA_START=30 /DNA_END=971 /DNA_ORIENTATION=+